jgi:hypothetical protein
LGISFISPLTHEIYETTARRQGKSPSWGEVFQPTDFTRFYIDLFFQAGKLAANNQIITAYHAGIILLVR